MLSGFKWNEWILISLRLSNCCIYQVLETTQIIILSLKEELLLTKQKISIRIAMPTHIR